MTIEHQPDNHRYVLLEHGDIVGVVDYLESEGVLSLVRAEVPPELRGQGKGATLVRGTLETIRREGTHKVIPVCPYIAKFIMKNAEFRDLRA